MTDHYIHKGRTPLGMIINERDSRITFRYKEDTVVQRAAKRIELERVKRIERKAARRALQQRELHREIR
ncbi:hypothetical protein AB0C34_17580 [Nocardia sp. NPDC049220]|uniref:hypothetical protein n=1 Tax=Nocardia sp. NPDC049220 TaxID=3155273 RepID=UPI0033E2008D